MGGLNENTNPGFYAGYVASSFTFGRFLSGYAWGSATDIIGRKPVIIIGLLSITIFSIIFGMSETYAMAIITRFILGLTNGIMPALRTSLSEVCGPEHVVLGKQRATITKDLLLSRLARSVVQNESHFPTQTLNSHVSGAISMVIGTGIGGLLVQPALHYPTLFSPTGLFARYPFLLPNLVGAVLSVFALVLVIFYLPETKDYNKRR
ncbi:unnamed protein product [Ectocarpus sp. CCAP 1310/34]|nr:unnamed protein product [Ectocarpus sp. CCAP 1310/34]